MANVTITKRQSEEILTVLKAHFEKSMNRHKGLEWAKVQAKLEANAEKLWSLHEMEDLEVNRMLLVMIERRANTFFMIVRQKVLKAAEASVTTVKR